MISDRYAHPGPLIRKQVMSRHLSRRTVTQLAPWLGIGRPALSRFLNGRSYASPALAYAFETKLGFKAEWILEQQARHQLAEYLAAPPSCSHTRGERS